MPQMHLNAITSEWIDVAIVGAGPIGLAAGIWFGHQGFRVVIIEKYGDVPAPGRRAFNQRHQQVGLDPTSLDFLKRLSPTLESAVRHHGCQNDDWVNIPILKLQNLMVDQLANRDNIVIVYNCTVETVARPASNGNARLVLAQGDTIMSVCPELIVVCDGRHDGTGVAKQLFDFSAASRVTLSSLGVIGMVCRLDTNPTPSEALTCLTNYSSDTCPTRIGPMHVRLLGSLQERYIALGAADDVVKRRLNSLSEDEIDQLLKTAFHQLKDPREPDIDRFTEVSTRPISIVLDYRKETIKLLEGTNTIVTVEGDAARKTTFFSGSGLNSGYLGLDQLFTFCTQHRDLIFNSSNLLDIDTILLKKDRSSLEISLDLLNKGIRFVLTPQSYQASCSQSKDMPSA